MNTAIVGAGAAGLSLAMLLEGQVTVFEAEDGPGGLCRSRTESGFTWDQGPHILGGIPEAVEWVKQTTGLEFVEGETQNVAWVDREIVSHPFDDEKTARRYVAKMWKTDPGKLDRGGLGAQPGRRPGGVARYSYPIRGGYQAVTDSWAAWLDVRYGEQVSADDLKSFDRVVWTAPVGRRYNHLATVTLGYQGIAPPYTAIYIPGRGSFHRVSFPSAFAPNNAPDGCFSVQGEVSIDGQIPHNLIPELAHLIEAFGITGTPIVSRLEVSPFAYPVPLYATPLRNGSLIFHGRTGGHQYLNIDGVVAASMALARHLNL